MPAAGTPGSASASGSTRLSQAVIANDTVHARIGTIAANSLSLSGRASGSALAAAVMARSSAALGITMDRRLATLDSVPHPTTIGSTQADGPSRRTAFHKGPVVATPLATPPCGCRFMSDNCSGYTVG